MIDLDLLRQVDGEPFWPKARVRIRFKPNAYKEVLALYEISERSPAALPIGPLTRLLLEKRYVEGLWHQGQRELVTQQYLYEDPAALNSFIEKVLPGLEIFEATPS